MIPFTPYIHALLPCQQCVLIARSLYIVCLLLSVKYSLFGFAEEVHAGVLRPGSGALEDGLLLALQALGGAEPCMCDIAAAVFVFLPWL
jgi:hypothetical protein